MEENEEELTERLSEDLDSGFTELVRLYATPVRTFLLRVTGSATEADDLTQDTFLRAYTALRGYTSARCRALRPRAWLMTIAANCWRNQMRTSMRRPVSVATIEDSCESWSDAKPDPEEQALTAADRDRLVSALASLPDGPRVAIVLRHVIGLTYAEIAESQECPVGTVKAQVSRGVKSLRKFLSTDDSPSREVAK